MKSLMADVDETTKYDLLILIRLMQVYARFKLYYIIFVRAK